MSDDLDVRLAREARRLGLDAEHARDADEDRVRDFCGAVLRELAARGLMGGPAEVEEVGCFARPRSPHS